MVPAYPYGWSAEYRFSDTDFGEFDEFLRFEFAGLPSGWKPSFGKVSYFDRNVDTWKYLYLIRGRLPGMRSKAAAEKKVRAFTHDLGRAFRLAHANPGNRLPEPEIMVWRLS